MDTMCSMNGKYICLQISSRNPRRKEDILEMEALMREGKQNVNMAARAGKRKGGIYFSTYLGTSLNSRHDKDDVNQVSC